LPELITDISKIDGIEWIKLHYFYPANFPTQILDVIKNNPKVCKYIDIAFQHISDNMLSKMKRNINKQKTIELINLIRAKIPQIHIRTTILVGHPHETTSDFNELVNFVQTSKFERLGTFTYSNEENTYAGDNYKDTISEKTKQKRAEKIMNIQQEMSTQINANKIGQTLKVIIDRKEQKKYIGRTEFDSPEVDNEVIITSKNKLTIGNFYNVKITDSSEFDLIGNTIF
jgi:ribosomal protein S12 methylthiotransferase